MTDYQYIDYSNLIDVITKGNYIINQPLIVDGNKISFLEKILNYSTIDQSNLHLLLVEIINKIKKKLYQEQLNQNVQLLMNHVQGEWLNGMDKMENNCNLFCDHECKDIINVQEHIIIL